MAGIDAYTVLLIQSNTTDGSTTFVDSSPGGHSVAVNGDTHHETDQQKFGTTSIHFDGTGDYLSFSDSPDWSFGSDDWTVDFWCYPTANLSYNIAAASRSGAGLATNFFIYLQCAWAGAGGNIAAAVRDDNDNDLELLTSTSYTQNAWQHIALVHDGNTMRLFKGGIQIGALDVTGITLKDPSGMAIGTDFGNYFAGYIDEFRVSKGIARWNTNFSVPTEPYTLGPTDLQALVATSSLSAGIAQIIPMEPLVATGEIPTPSIIQGDFIDAQPLSSEMVLDGKMIHVWRDSLSSSATIYETIGLTWIKSVESTAEITEEVSLKVGISVSEVLTARDAVSTRWTGTESVESTLGMFGTAVMARVFNESVISTLEATETVTSLHRMIDSVSSSLGAEDAVTTRLMCNPHVMESVAISGLVTVLRTLNETVDESMNISDHLGFSWLVNIEDGMAIEDAAAVRLLAIHMLTSDLEVTDTAMASLNFTDAVTDTLGIAAEVAVKQLLREHITEILHFGIVVELDNALWECWVLNTNAFHASVYSGFSFNSYAVHNNTAYGCKRDGIYELSGDTDDGTAFKSGVVLPESRFGTHHFKRFRKAYFGIIGSAPAIRLVNEDGTSNTYTISKSTVTPTRGVKGRRWTLSIGDFDSLDFIELAPIMLSSR